MDKTYDLYSSHNSFQKHLTSIFVKMAIAMALTSATAFGVYLNIVQGGAFSRLLANPLTMIVIIIAELAVTVSCRSNLFNTKKQLCKALFYVYAVINGITFGILPLMYNLGTLATAFLYTTIFFVCCAVIGYTTKKDLSSWGTVLFSGLITLIVVSLLSLVIPFLRNSMFISYAGVLLFMAYTAYDIQKIRKNYFAIDVEDVELLENFAVYGAFELYLDFINLFLDILRIIGNRSRD